MKPYLTIEIPTYGICVAIGLYAVFSLMCFRIKKYDYNWRLMLIISPIILLGMFIGAKLLYVITQIPHIAVHHGGFIESLMILFGGQVYYGGVIGACLATGLCVRILKLDRKKLYSFLAPIFVIFHSIGRIGCFFGGCCYGIPSHFGFAMADSPDIIRFPVQLFEAGFELILGIILLVIEQKKGVRNNNMIIYLGVYAVFRFCIEFFRGDTVRGIWFWGISTSQIVAIIILLFLSIYYIVKKHTQRMSSYL